MTRVLVTGATGFIGRNTLAPLVTAGHEVHALSTGRATQRVDAVTWHRGDLLTSNDVVAEAEPDVLLHLAWYVEPGRFWTAPENVHWVEASLALLRAFIASGGRRAVIAGTSAEYDWGGLDDRCRELETPLRPATLYGAAKHALHLVAAPYAEQEGVQLCWGRIFFAYGPGEPDGRLVPSVGRTLLAEEPVATTSGEQVRDFLHVADAGRAFAALVDSEVTGPVNVASGEPVRVRELVERLAAAAGRPDLLRLGALPDRKGDPARLVADVTRLRDEVGFRPRIDLADGLDQTLEWLRSTDRAA